MTSQIQSLPATTCAPLDTPGTLATVYQGTQRIGTVKCINTARASEPAQVRYFGMNAAGTASGQAHPTQARAVGDVANWHAGREVVYEQHGRP